MYKKYLQILISVLLIVSCLYYAFRGVSIEQLKNALASLHYLYLVPATLMVALGYLVRAMRWRYLIRSVKEVRTTALFSPLMVGFMGNILPARAGELIRAYLLSRKADISFSASFATIFIERLFDLVLVLLLLALALFLMPAEFAGGDKTGIYRIAEKMKYFGGVSFSLCMFIFLFSALLQFRNDLAMRTVEFFTRPLSAGWKEKIVGFVNSFSDGLKIIRDKRGFIAATLLSFLLWGLLVFTYYPLYLAFDIGPQLPIMSSLVVLSVTVAVFITIAPTPGFLGSYHLACVAALHGIFGIQKAVALSYGIVAWLLGMGFTVIAGAAFVIMENISFGEVSAHKEQLEDH